MGNHLLSFVGLQYFRKMNLKCLFMLSIVFTVTQTRNQGCKKCGVKKTDKQAHGFDYIYNGVEAGVNEYPWMAQVKPKGTKSYCGGALVTSKWVLTARHCVTEKPPQPNKPPSYWEVALGEHDVETRAETSITRSYNVDLIVLHPKHDIAMVRLSEPADISIYTPVCLPRQHQDFTGQEATLTGWGVTDPKQQMARKLQELEGLRVISESDCNAPMQLCLACPKYKCGAYGDSGSPMIVKGPDGSHTLVGTVIGGNGKQHFATGERMFAAEVSEFLPWIESTMRKKGKGQTCSY